MLLAIVSQAAAHGTTFGSVAISVRPDDPAEIWVLTDTWGLAHTTTGGDDWAWLCEESLGSTAIYGVLARGAGQAVIATREGVRLVDDACGTTIVPGIPEDTFVPTVAAYGAGYLALSVGEAEGGLWHCDDAGCVASDLLAPGLFPKSALADGARAWATVVYEDGLASELWRTDDGAAWTLVHAWPGGDTDPRLLLADGDHLLLWRRTRAEDDTPQLLESHDGGETFSAVFETGYFTDAAPALLVLDGQLLLGSYQGARTWRSTDDGATWTEVSADVPAVRCATTVAGTGWACTEHLQDGFDVARTTDGGTWQPIACLEEAEPPACADGTCSPLLDAFQLAGSYGGGKCDTLITPPVAEADPDPAPCGCGGGGESAALFGFFYGLKRRKRRVPAKITVPR